MCLIFDSFKGELGQGGFLGREVKKGCFKRGHKKAHFRVENTLNKNR